MKPLALAASLVPLLAAAAAHGIEYSPVQADKSTLTFISRQMGVPVNGRFPRFTAQISFDPAKAEAGKVNFSIDLPSIDAGSADASDEVVGKDWFNVRMFPTATFSASSMKSLGGGKYEVTGPLAIKGRSKPVTARFAFKAENHLGILDGGFALKRLDYAIGEGTWTDVSMVADEVQVNFHIVVAATAAAAISPPSKATNLVKSK